MSVWLTPNLSPVYGGTYYPPNDRYYSQPGFTSILKSLSKQWKENPEKFDKSGKRILAVLSESAAFTSTVATIPSALICSKKCFEQLDRTYDQQYGGFGRSPKFPQPVNLAFLLYLSTRPKTDFEISKKAHEMCIHTLKKMAKGGMYDHVSKGFARYSTDEKWHVPHFEKMLYDQAQLIHMYADAYVVTRVEKFADVIRDTVSYCCDILSDPSGGFYSAEDADSYPEDGAKEKREGAFYVWTFQEIQELLNQQATENSKATVAEIICHHFGILPNGNIDPYQDPHDELKNKNVLIVGGSVKKTAAKFNIPLDVLRDVLQSALKLMREARSRRPRPHLDDKMLAAWNGLMISALARAGTALKDSSYIERAIKAARFLRAHLFDEEDGELLRSCYRGSDETPSQISKPIHGFLDDYAFTIRGLLDLFTACQDDRWLKWAEDLQRKQDELFWDEKHGAYFVSPATDASIVARMKEDQDGAEPSGNSVAVSNLERLSLLFDEPLYHEKAGQILQVFHDKLETIPVTIPEMVTALMTYEDNQDEVVLVGRRNSPETEELLHHVLSHPRLLRSSVIVFDPDESGEDFLPKRRASLASMTKIEDKTTVYVCRNRSCSAPVTSIEELNELLE